MPVRPPPLLSVVVNNYNGALWLERCFASLRAQTIADQIEIIVADNASPDQSAALAGTLMQGWANGRVVEHAKDLGYCESNNRAARLAHGRYLFFLNNDTWLEPDCLEKLLQEAQAKGATIAAPLVLNYVDDTIQTAGEAGFDLFGLMSHQADWSATQEIFVAAGCCLLIEASRFRELGGFDTQFMFYADEFDLCWRVWLTGGTVILVPAARMHHRGGTGVNPQGREQILENRTSDTKRYYANRNNLLVLLKNGEHVLLTLALFQLLLLAAEALFTGALTRRWSHIRRAYLEALRDCWRMRSHIFFQRRFLRKLRQRGDLWMLRFLRGRFNRWEELRRFLRFGSLKVDAK